MALTSESKQVLIDIQLKNRDVNTQLQSVTKELEELRKSMRLMENEAEKLVGWEKQESAEMKKLEKEIASCEMQEKKLVAQQKQLQQQAANYSKALREQSEASQKLAQIDEVLSREHSDLSQMMEVTRQAIAELSIKEKELATDSTATAESFNKIEGAQIGLQATLKQLQKDYKGIVKDVMFARDAVEGEAQAEEKATTHTKQHGRMLQQFASYAGSATGNIRDLVWVFSDLSNSLSMGAAAMGNIVGTLAGFGVSMLRNIPTVKKFMESLDPANSNIGKFEKSLKELDWAALAAGASLQDLFSIMMKSAQLDALSQRIKDDQVALEKLKELSKENFNMMARNVAGTYAMVQAGEDVAPAWQRVNAEARKWGVNISDLTKDAKGAQIAIQRISEAIQKHQRSLADDGIAITKNRDEIQKKIDALKKEESQTSKNIKSSEKQEEQERIRLETAKLQDALRENGIKLTKEETLEYEKLIKNHKEWESKLAALIQKVTESREKDLKEIRAYADSIGAYIQEEMLDKINHLLATKGIEEAKKYIDQLAKAGHTALEYQVQEIESYEQKVQKAYQQLATLSSKTNTDINENLETFKGVLEAMGIYGDVKKEIYQKYLEDTIKKDSEMTGKMTKNTDTLISELEKMGQAEDHWNEWSRKRQLEWINDKAESYAQDFNNYETYMDLRSRIAQKQAEEEKRIYKEAKKEMLKIFSDMLSQIMTIWNNYYATRIQAQEENTKDYIHNLQVEKDMGLVTEQEYQSKVNAAMWKEKIEKDRILAEQAKAQRAQAIASAIMSTAQGIMEVVKTYAGMPWLMAAFIAMITGLGAAQIAAITSAPIPKAKKGGEVGGKSHEEGGTLIEAEKGEYIIPKKTYQANRGVIAAISGGGGAGGAGISSFDAAFKQLLKNTNDFTETITNMKIYAAIEDIRKAEQNYISVTDIKI